MSLLIPYAAAAGAGPDIDIEALLWGQFGCSLLAFFVVFCTPMAPPTPPSGTAHVDAVAQPVSTAWCRIFRAFLQLGSSRAALAVSLTGGMFFGLMYAWLAGAGGRFNLGAWVPGLTLPKYALAGRRVLLVCLALTARVRGVTHRRLRQHDPRASRSRRGSLCRRGIIRGRSGCGPRLADRTPRQVVLGDCGNHVQPAPRVRRSRSANRRPGEPRAVHPTCNSCVLRAQWQQSVVV